MIPAARRRAYGAAASLPLIDGIGGTAAMAYSTRKVRSGYSGSCLRLRRDSDSAESDFGFDGSGWLDAASVETWLSGATGYVKTWYDQSGSGRDATQTTASRQPRLDILDDDRVAVQFDGVDDYMSITNPITHGSNDWTFATVCAPTWAAVASGNRCVYAGPSGSISLEFAGGTSTNLQITNTWVAVVQTGAAVSTGAVCQSFWQRNGSTTSTALNGATAMSSSYGGSYSGSNQYLGWQSMSSWFYSGSVLEFIGYTSVISNPSANQMAAFGVGSSSYPLDGLSLPHGAFSTRKLRRYAGLCFRLRRSSDSAERDFGFDSTGWVDSTAISSWLGASTGYVKTWYDQSNSGKDATQATASAQPAYSASGTNSKPALSFDGSDDRLNIANAIAHGTGNWSVASVIQMGSVSATCTIYAGTGSGQLQLRVNWGALQIINSGVAAVLASSVSVSLGVAAQTFFQRSSNTHSVSKNGGTPETASSSQNYAASARIGESSSGERFNGLIAEHLIWMSAESNPSTDQKTAYSIP